jgi:hypothetical protein
MQVKIFHKGLFGAPATRRAHVNHVNSEDKSPFQPSQGISSPFLFWSIAAYTPFNKSDFRLVGYGDKVSALLLAGFSPLSPFFTPLALYNKLAVFLVFKDRMRIILTYPHFSHKAFHSAGFGDETRTSI